MQQVRLVFRAVHPLLRVVALVAAIVLGTSSTSFAQTSPCSGNLSAGKALDCLLFNEGPFTGNTNLDYRFLEAESIRNAMEVQSRTFPINSSSSGFAFEFDAAQGLLRPVTRTYGPLFAERALTSGRKSFSLTLGYQRLKWNSLEGDEVQTDGGGMQYRVFYDPADFSACTGPSCLSYFAQCNTNITTNVTTVSANYGLTDSIDIGVAIPIVHTVVEGSSLFADLDSSGRVTGVNPIPQLRGSSTGIGDVNIRGKFSFFKRGSTAVGVIDDLRVGTGKQKRYDLLATNDLQNRIMLVASTEKGRFSPHVNVGYAASRNLNDEFQYTAGTDIQVADRVTLTADLVGRHVRNNARCSGVAFASLFCASDDDPLNTFGIVDETPQGRVIGTAPSFAEPGAFESEARLVGDSRNLLVGALGTKVRVTGQFLLMATVLIQTNEAGFRPSPALVLGLEQSWGGR